MRLFQFEKKSVILFIGMYNYIDKALSILELFS